MNWSSINISLINLFLIIGFIQGLFLIVVLLFHKRNKKRKGTILLLALILSLSICLLFHLMFIEFFQLFPKFTISISGSVFLLGPLLYLYLRQMTMRRLLSPLLLNGLHLIPFLIYTILLLYIVLPAPNSIIIQEFKIDEKLISDYKGLPWIAWIKLIHLFLYGVASVILVYRYKKNQRKNLSSIQIDRLKWFHFLVYGFSFLIFLPFLFILSDYASIFFIEKNKLDEIITIYIAVWIFAIAYYWMQAPDIFVHNHNNKETKKYSTSTLTENKKRELLIEVQKLMKEKKIFLNPDLTLAKLSSQLSVRPHHLSQVINEKIGLSFFDFVNQYRVNEFKQLISNNKNTSYTLLGIAFEVGFNNKVSFNKAFKKFTGMTPTEYIKTKRQKNNLQKKG